MYKTYPLPLLPVKKMTLHGDSTCLKVRDDDSGKWRNLKWDEVGTQIQRTAEALVAFGIGVQQPVGVFSENMKEFLYTDMGCLSIRAYGVPLYATLSTGQVKYIVEDSGMRLLFVGGQRQYDCAYPITQTHDLTLVAYDPEVTFAPEDERSMYFTDFLEKGARKSCQDEVEKRRVESREEDTAFILYTSGTSGESKGVILTHLNVATSINHHAGMPGIKAQNISMNFLPMTHIFEKMWCLLCLQCGIIIAINTDPHQITTTLPEIRPHYMCNVPRFWEKVYLGVREKMEHMPPSLNHVSQDCLKVCHEYQMEYLAKEKTPPLGLKMKYKMYEKTLLKLVKKTVGIDRGVLFPVSGAALSKEVHGFLLSFAIPIAYGYGATETTATVSYCMPEETKFGSIGKPLDHLQIRIDQEAGGELLVKGSSITTGYYNKPEENAKAFTEDGFFRTGDLVTQDEDGYLYFKERSKDLYKTANGKYIAPQMLEGLMVSDSVIEQALVVADKRNFVSALIYPNWSKLTKLLGEQEGGADLPQDPEVLRKSPEVTAFLQERLNHALRDVAEYERVKKFYIIPEPFTIENGQLTNSLKAKRAVILSRYQDEINDLYGYALN